MPACGEYRETEGANVADPSIEFIREEYFALMRAVSQFDDRFLVIKGWSVTFSFALIVSAVMKKIKLLFLVAALSAVSFWMLEASMKMHQMRYYPRMRQIETALNSGDETKLRGPAVDWGWQAAGKLLVGERTVLGSPVSESRSTGNRWEAALTSLKLWLRAAFFPHVWLPYVVPFSFGLALFFGGRRFQPPGTAPETPRG